MASANSTKAATSAAAASSAALRAQRIFMNSHYPADVWWIVLGVIGVLTAFNALGVVVKFARKRHHLRNTDDIAEKNTLQEQTPNLSGRLVLRRLPLAALNALRIAAFRCTLPLGSRTVATLADTFFCVAYIGLLLLWSFINTHDLTMSFWANRTATLASSQVPLLPVLAAKNNIITLLTGISHEKQNILHRTVARTVLLLLWLHGGSRFALGLIGADSLTHVWVRLGVVSLIALTLCSLVSIRPIRAKTFEFFLISHNVLIFIFMLTGFFHMQISRKMGYWVWPAFLLWGLDRAMRLVRFVVNNRIWRFNNTATTATVETVSHDTVRISMLRPMSWRPGQHAYLTLPAISQVPFEAHPFTIASIPSPLGQDTCTKDSRELTFIVRGRDGFTGRLRQFVGSTGSRTVKAFIDGPYGNPPDLSTFSTSILIAGGSGVSYTLPLLQDLVQQVQRNAACTRRIVFVWVVREEANLSWIHQHLITAVNASPTGLEIYAAVFITQTSSAATSATVTPIASPMPSRPPSSLSVKKPSLSKIPSAFGADLTSGGTHAGGNVGVRVYYGRPDLAQVLNDEINASRGSTSVDVSGPASIIASVRGALRTSSIAGPSGIMRGKQSVSLHVETFGM